jgi:homoaconitase/3-isopropylmalate dehydratase large subunit
MSRRRKAPTKTELLQLQKLYKTDEKIGERLGGVPAYLVAYWRRKKNIPKHSLPKFSELEVRNLWERYGDDEKAGLELGLSKAAFYNWRRRYGIKEKPAFLKLEQLEFNFPGAKTTGAANNLYGKQTMAQKIITRVLRKEKDHVEVGEEVLIEPDLVVTHDDSGRIAELFKKASIEYVWNPNKIAVTFDEDNAHRHGSETGAVLREFLKRQRIKNIYDLREGLGHQAIMEKGLILPGQMAVATDESIAAYGSIGAFSAEITPEEAAHVWSSGKLKLTVPGTIKLSITGRRGRAVSARDILLAVVRKLSRIGANGKVIEYGGSIMPQLTMSERFTLAGLSSDLGACGAICPYDASTRRYLTGRNVQSYRPVIPDKNAEYAEMYQISIDQLTPQIDCPGDEVTIKTAQEMEGTSVQLILLGSLSNGRFDDLRVAADILKGKQVHADCRLLIVPASRSVYLEALKKGLIRVFLEAGAVLLGTGNFGPSVISGLSSGDKCLATAGTSLRRGCPGFESQIYLCSPATAAASALHASITDPARFLR